MSKRDLLRSVVGSTMDLNDSGSVTDGVVSNYGSAGDYVYCNKAKCIGICTQESHKRFFLGSARKRCQDEC